MRKAQIDHQTPDRPRADASPLRMIAGLPCTMADPMHEELLPVPVVPYKPLQEDLTLFKQEDLLQPPPLLHSKKDLWYQPEANPKMADLDPRPSASVVASPRKADTLAHSPEVQTKVKGKTHAENNLKQLTSILLSLPMKEKKKQHQKDGSPPPRRAATPPPVEEEPIPMEAKSEKVIHLPPDHSVDLKCSHELTLHEQAVANTQNDKRVEDSRPSLRKYLACKTWRTWRSSWTLK